MYDSLCGQWFFASLKLIPFKLLAKVGIRDSSWKNGILAKKLSELWAGAWFFIFTIVTYLFLMGSSWFFAVSFSSRFISDIFRKEKDKWQINDVPWHYKVQVVKLVLRGGDIANVRFLCIVPASLANLTAF